MYRLLVDDEVFYFKNKITLIDFLDDNLPDSDNSVVPIRQFRISIE